MFVAKFVGEINVFEGRIIEVHNGSAVVDIHGRPFKVQNRKNFTAGQNVKVLLRPEDIMVTKDEESYRITHLRLPERSRRSSTRARP